MSRIYKQKTNINENDAKMFWNDRAKKYDANNPYVTVLLGDKNPERTQKMVEHGEKSIISLLNITFEDTVLDVGCGVGRLAEVIIPKCSFYLGIDYAEDLIEIAKNRIDYPGKKYAFAPLAIQDIYRGSNGFAPYDDIKYSVIILSGIFACMNDDTAKLGLHNLLTIMADSCRIYYADSIGISQRLTLDNFYSDDLESSYSVIYRTEDEIMELLFPLTENGIQLIKRGDIAEASAGNSETKWSYFVFERR